MEILAVVGAVAAFLYFTRSQAPATAATSTPAPAPAEAKAIRTPPAFSGAGSIVSGGYQTAPYNSAWGSPLLFGKGAGTANQAAPAAFASVANAVASSAFSLGSTIASPPVPAPPPVQRGGIAGTVGTGGLPLGGPLRTGISSGTATTVVGTTGLQSLPKTKNLF